MKILVTGANGFVGQFLCAELLGQGNEVVRAARHSNRSEVNLTVVGSIEKNTNWSDALHQVDTVIHLAARVHIMTDKAVNPLAEYRKVNVEGTLNLAQQAVKVGVKRFIYISTAKVNGESTQLDKPFTEVDLPNPQDDYGTSKFEAEQCLLAIARQTNMEVVIIRPPLVYGEGVKANFASLMRVIKKGVPLPFGAIYNKRSFVYVENLVSLIVCCINHPKAANHIFLVSDGQDLSTTELLKAIAKALGVRLWLLPIPRKLIEFVAATLRRRAMVQRLCGNLQLDISKAGNVLGWEPAYTVEYGLKKTAASFFSYNKSK
jgi:nucleoside-diphosphate-sugar epimerase